MEDLEPYFLFNPRFVMNPDLRDFDQQPSDIDGIECEWVCQSGGQMGDDFHGTMAYPLDNEGRFFTIEYHSK
jgi:hypothetical protein